MPWPAEPTIEEGIDWTHPLLDIVEDQRTALDRMTAWAERNGHDHLLKPLTAMLSNSPTSGFAVMLDDPAAVLIAARWDRCTEEHPLGRV